MREVSMTQQGNDIHAGSWGQRGNYCNYVITGAGSGNFSQEGEEIGSILKHNRFE